MGTEDAEVVESLPLPHEIKVHCSMCFELRRLLGSILNIFQEIENARPRCSSGLEALCLLNRGIERAKSLLTYCSESSKLYLALTGDAILSRCGKARNLMEQSLCMIKNDVPVMLSAEISNIIYELQVATFSLDASDMEAGKALKSLLQKYSSVTDSKEEESLETLRFVALRLDITSQKALVIEMRSIKKLLVRIGQSEPPKKQILLFCLNLMKKYGKLIIREQMENAYIQSEDRLPFPRSVIGPVNMEHYMKHGFDEAQIDMKMPVPPEEFKCPISERLMFDPVIIASGQTFERMWIQKWFDEGHNTCPKTKRKLSHLSLTPNTVMKTLISKWCTAHEVSIPDPYLQSASIKSYETSSTSIASLGNSMVALNIPMDFSSVSLGSLEFSCNSDSSNVKLTIGTHCTSTKTDDICCRNQSGAGTSKMEIEFLDDLGWESRCKMVEDTKNNLELHIQEWPKSSKRLVEQIIKFLKDAGELHDVKAQRSGCQLLLAIARKCRNSVSYFPGDACDVFASLLSSELFLEVLAILELLSCHKRFRLSIATSNVLDSLAKVLDTPIWEFLKPAVTILYNLSCQTDIRHLIVPLKLVPKLMPHFEDIALARSCLAILKNLCDYEAVRVALAETNGCIASITKLLDTGNDEDEEYALTILLSLCSQSILYCQLVMDEGVIPALVHISINGNEKGQAGATEMLRLLRDVKFSDEVPERHATDFGVSKDSLNPSKERKSSTNLDASKDSLNLSKERKSSSKAHGLLGKIFSRANHLAPKRKK